MTQRFRFICDELDLLIDAWKVKLNSLSPDTIGLKRNRQNRTIRQIVGHMIDSATNNTHRIIHMQYQESPIQYPDYANLGNNDRWISIQNFQEEDWTLLVALWASTNRHILHVIKQVREDKLHSLWISALDEEVTLKAMITDFPRHFKLHLQEIDEIIQST